MNVKDLREKSGLTQDELSEKTGIPRGRIAKWEQGKGNPKSADERILETIFGKNVREQVPRNGSVRPQEAQGLPDYKDRYIQILEELNEIRRLSSSQRVNFERRVLLIVEENQFLLKTILQVLAQNRAKADKRKVDDVIVELNNLTEQHRVAFEKGDS